MPTPLLGRADELARLDEVLGDLWAGGSPGLVVSGEPGIGKSRLLAELTDRARARGGLVLAGRAAEYETDLPFAPWVDALDAHVAGHPGLGLNPAELAALSSVLPALEPAAADAPQSVERHRLHAAMRSLLAALAAAPLVLVLDDLHWADRSSIDLIAALLRRPPAAEVMLALAFRHRQASDRLVAAVDRAEREDRTVSVRLAPLDADTASALLGADLPASTRELLFLESGGNPFYLEHLARSARSADAGAADGRAALPGVPRAVAAALADELRRVTGATRTVLDAAAVIGVDFDPETVAAVAEVAPEVVIDALDELVAADLMRPSIHPRRFTIRHPLVRRAIYDTTGAGWRLLAHERAAASLRSRGEASETLAHHVAVSARAGDEDAIGVLLEAALAVHVAAPASAARWIADAIELMPPEPAERRREWMVQLAAAEAAAGQVAHARTTLLAALDLVPSDAAGERVRLTVRSVGLDRLLGRHHDGHERLIRTLAALPGQATDEHALLYVTLAVDSFHRAELADMVSWGERAIAAGRDRSARAVTATGLAVVAFAAALTGDTARARDLCDEAAALFERLNDEELATSLEAAQFLGLLEMYIERFAAAAAHARRGIEAARATGNAQMVPVLAVPLGYSTAMLGQLDESRAVLEGAVEQERLVDSRFAAVWVLMNAGVTAWLAGDLARSRAAATEVLEALADMDETIVTGNAKSVLGIIELEERRFQAAVDLFLEAGGGPELPLIGGFWRVMVLEALMEAELGCGRPRLAKAAADLAGAAAETLQLDLPHAVALRAHATLALREGDSERAATLALEAIERAGRTEARIETERTRLLAGQALAAAGRRAEAVSELQAAAEQLEACGARRLAEAARGQLKRLGSTGHHTARGERDVIGLSALTERELAIAELVWDRRTNREIAETLFLSPKTIESHLRNIFAKVRVSSRVELAREVERARAIA